MLPKFVYDQPERKPYKCPVCEGRGHVPFDFYDSKIMPVALSIMPESALAKSISTEPESCKSCNGSGVVWE